MQKDCLLLPVDLVVHDNQRLSPQQSSKSVSIFLPPNHQQHWLGVILIDPHRFFNIRSITYNIGPE